MDKGCESVFMESSVTPAAVFPFCTVGIPTGKITIKKKNNNKVTAWQNSP